VPIGDRPRKVAVDIDNNYRLIKEARHKQGSFFENKKSRNLLFVKRKLNPSQNVSTFPKKGMIFFLKYNF
jgi:hypothetical protein